MRVAIIKNKTWQKTSECLRVRKMLHKINFVFNFWNNFEVLLDQYQKKSIQRVFSFQIIILIYSFLRRSIILSTKHCSWMNWFCRVWRIFLGIDWRFYSVFVLRRNERHSDVNNPKKRRDQKTGQTHKKKKKIVMAFFTCSEINIAAHKNKIF